MATEKVYETTREALERVQTFDPTTLGRVDDLGRQMNFAEAVKPAEAIIAVYKRIPMSALADFTDGQLNAILGQANADYNLFKQILDFNAASSDAVSTRTNILANFTRPPRSGLRSALAVRGVRSCPDHRYESPRNTSARHHSGHRRSSCEAH